MGPATLGERKSLRQRRVLAGRKIHGAENVLYLKHNDTAVE